MSQLYHSAFSDELCPSSAYRVRINGEEVFVHQCEIASFCLLSAEGEIHVEIEALFSYTSIRVKPLSSAISPVCCGRHISFTAKAPCKLCIEHDDDIRSPLFLLANPVACALPDPTSPKVRCFHGGQVYHAGLIELHDGETLYLEDGAFVYGQVYARNASDICIMGRGVLCGCLINPDDEAVPSQVLRLNGCRNVLIEGITVFGGPNWHVVPVACENVTIRNINVITWKGTGDGIDIVGSEHVTVAGCFVRSMDDCIALKSVHYMGGEGCKPVRNVRVSSCVFWNAEWGNAIEIGYETRSETICDIVFEDIDVIRAEYEGYESGGTFTIHNGDRALVSNVLYQNIRVEDSREKLIDMKILFSQYSRDADRGQIRGIRFKDIQIVDGAFPVSIIRGYSGKHMIEDVCIENLVVHGRRITNATDAKMVIELSKNVRFV